MKIPESKNKKNPKKRDCPEAYSLVFCVHDYFDSRITSPQTDQRIKLEYDNQWYRSNQTNRADPFTYYFQSLSPLLNSIFIHYPNTPQFTITLCAHNQLLRYIEHPAKFNFSVQPNETTQRTENFYVIFLIPAQHLTHTPISTLSP